MRNVGGSIGIATITAFLVRGAQAHQNTLAGNLTPTNIHAQALLQGLTAKFIHLGASPASAHAMAMGALYRSTLQQSALLAYADNFQILGFLGLLCILPVLLLAKIRHRALEPKTADK